MELVISGDLVFFILSIYKGASVINGRRRFCVNCRLLVFCWDSGRSCVLYEYRVALPQHGKLAQYSLLERLDLGPVLFVWSTSYFFCLFGEFCNWMSKSTRKMQGYAN